MRFASESALWLLVLVPVLAGFLRWGFIRLRRRRRAFADPVLWERLNRPAGSGRRLGAAVCLTASVGLLALVPARPQWGYHWEDLRKRGIDLVVAVDTSRSMLADDIKPDRLERTRRELEDLLAFARGDRIGLVVFSGQAFTLCPLTHDYGAVRMFVNDIRVGSVPRGGTDIAAAVDRSLELLGEEQGESDKAVLLISDGESLEGDWEAAAARARERGVKIFTIGIGTPEGAPIRLKTPVGEEYLKDRQGNIVVSRLDETVLERLALETGGAYHRATPTGLEIERIYRDGIAGMNRGETASRRKRVYEHRYQIPLALALGLLAASLALGEAGGAPFFSGRGREEEGE
ncbi:MAG TPA: VWA domain-containing protein [bacterium]|nr:VWA domain-containing protein [bacterium]HPQ66344.1 VWA domain-containing protein [bacterium]